MVGLIEPMKYGEHFHELYTNNDNGQVQPERKAKQKRNKSKEKKNENNVPDQLYPSYAVAHIELEPNASKFAVYSAIRSAVLEADTKYALFQEKPTKKTQQASPCCFVCAGTCNAGNLADCGCHINDKKDREDGNSEGESETEEASEKGVVVIQVPQIVGAGLKSLFELIADARNIQPNLCTKALKALMDVTQGQQPESFKTEPDELIDPLYDLLLDLAIFMQPSSVDKSIPCAIGTNWSSIACSALLGLCIARGDTGKIIKAIAALLMSPKSLSFQIIQLPMVLSSLQRTVISAALNKPTFPDFHSHGIPKSSLVDQFSMKTVLQPNTSYNTQPSMASDGTFLFLLNGNSLYKIGTGFNGSYKGHVYAVNNDFGKDKSGWLGYSGGKLYFKRLSKRSTESMLLVNTDNLAILGSSQIHIPSIKDGLSHVLFSDEDSINAICTNRDDSLVVKQISSNGPVSFELPLKLARKKFRTLGFAAFEDEVLNQNQIQKIQSSYNIFEPKLPIDLEIQGIACGKEFGIVRASNGKVYYYGKSASLGLKSVGRTPTMKMTELIIAKVSNIVHVSVGHDGIHALLVNDDGIVFFTGTARRGEDGDTSKNRRQPKAIKPKKLTKVDGHIVVQTAANNGTSAFVTKTGKLIMFGKDTAHCDSTGLVTDLLDQHITKVALGKAHCVALNSKGHLFTFGLNNKGQCGRIFSKDKENFPNDVLDNKASGHKLKLDTSNMCDFDDHNIIQGQCRVCMVCRECTGYNISCVSSLNLAMDERIPGALCPCGHGDAGCPKCGSCSSCIALQENESSEAKDQKNGSLVNRQRSKTIVLRKKEKKPVEENNVPSDAEKDPPRVAPLAPQRVVLPTSSPAVQIACGLHHTVVLTLAGEVFTFGSNQYGQLGTGDLQAVVGPTQVKVQGVISQIAAGSNHTVLLTYKGMVYTFGNFQKGQLGRMPNDFHKNSANDELDKESSARDMSAAAIAAQRQKYLWNCTPSAVSGLGLNFGKKATWVSAGGDQTFIKLDESLITTQMLPKVNIVADKKTIILIPTVPLSFHALTISRRDGNCAAHYRNQVNFVQMIQSNSNSMPEINQNIEPNLLPQNQQDQMSRSMHEARNQIFDLQENQLQAERNRRRQDLNSPGDKILPQVAFALDPFFNVLWVFDGCAKKILCYNVVASEIPQDASDASKSIFRSILSPELCLSHRKESNISRSQASMNLLACLDILTSAQDSIPSCFDQIAPQETNLAKELLTKEYQIVNRFENFGGGWGYSGHSVEAIRFVVDTDIMICGFGMFGGRGEYSCKLKVFDLGPEGGGYEKDGILISETKEIPYECPARSKYHIMLPKPITACAGRWYLVWARIAGPSSDCGSSGQAGVTTEDQIVFTFKSSKKANNGTDVNSGQIPSVLYRLITQEAKQPSMPIDIDPVHKVSKHFANTVTKECFENLVILLNWSWNIFKTNIRDQKDKARLVQIKNSLEHLIYVNKSCLRLLRKYTNEIYPEKMTKTSQGKKSSEINTHTYNISKGQVSVPKLFLGPNDLPTPTTRKANMENIQLAECIGNVRAILIQILCDDIFKDIFTEDGHDMVLDILEECHTSFVACFDVFYPTSSLKWNCLCDLLAQIDKGVLHSRLLSAIIAGLCSPAVKLRATFSLLTPGNERQSIISPSDNSGLPMLSSSENHQYPILVEQMIYRTQQEKIDFLSNSWTFKDVLVRLLDIIALPIKGKIESIYHRSVNFNETRYGKDINQGLINNCCHLLARVLAEIVYQTSVGDFDSTFMPPRSLHSTGSRFGRCDVSKTWNTGNFGPDAIGFHVDRPGIAIAGAMVYSGTGSYDYQLELLFDNTVDPQSQHKWETLESISGSYDQEAVQNDMTEIKFERPIHIKENARYAMRLCSQGARTNSGDSGLSSIRGPCGTTFTFHPCDLSFNGTTPSRGQIPCILYYSTPSKSEGQCGTYSNEITARDTALQIATDITKKCSELLVLARNALAASLSPSDKSPNSSNHTQTIDSEHNITPIEEHMDINWANNSRTAAAATQDVNISTARDITKRIESFSKGIIETLKFDKRSTNPFEFEIEIGATEINPKDLIDDSEINERNYRMGRHSKLNGNDRTDNEEMQGYVKGMAKSDSEESTQLTIVQLLELFNINSSNMFHTLLPLVYAHIGILACNDPKSSVQVLGLVKEILPHVSALNQLYASKEYTYCAKEEGDNNQIIEVNKKKVDDNDRYNIDICTTSNHYCTVESEHPYRSATISTYRVEFPPCVQWLTVEFDPQCGTAQVEDYLLVSIPIKPTLDEPILPNNDYSDILDNNMCSSSRSSCKNASIISSSYNKFTDDKENTRDKKNIDSDWMIIKKFNPVLNWSQNVLVLPGNRIEFSLETASLYAQDVKAKKFGFKCLVVGYDNPTSITAINSCLIRLEHELAYLGGMCSANLMKKDLNLPDDKNIDDLSGVEETLNLHHGLLSKGLALSDSVLTVNQALESFLPTGSQSNERQFLKDFISGAPGSSGARLAAWLQPEPRLDPNKCELNPIVEPVRFGWPTMVVVTIRDQYGDAVVVPELKVEIKAIPAGAVANGNRKMRRVSCLDSQMLGGVAPPPRLNYEPTIKEKMCFKAITFMKPFSQYSFEELRYCSPVQTRVTETLAAQDMEDGTFSVNWTPNSVGSYCLTVSIDGIPLEEIYRVNVKEGGIPPPQNSSQKKSQPPNKLRKFITKNSAGLRIRTHPTLQSEQVGIIKMNGVISFIDEIENDDGIWVRISTESIRQHCTVGWYPTEAWCLQYNQHFARSLLHPIIDPPVKVLGKKEKKAPTITSAIESIEPKTVAEPQLKITSNYSEVVAELTPPPLSSDTMASSTNPFVFSSDSGNPSENTEDTANDSAINEMFDLPKSAVQETQPVQQTSTEMSVSFSSSPSNISSAIAGVVGGGASKLQALQKWFKGDSLEGKDVNKSKSEASASTTSVSVRELVRAIGAQESKSNGNPGVSGYDRSSSPVFIPLRQSESMISSSSKSVEVSDTSALVSSLMADMSQSPKSLKEETFGSPKTGSDSTMSRSDVHAASVRLSNLSLGAGNTVIASPKHTPRKLRGKRSISPIPLKERNPNIQNLDMKVAEQMMDTTANNDQKTSSASTETASPPVWPLAPSQPQFQLQKDIEQIKPTTVKCGPPKRAMPPSLAESLRAVFSAFLWHEGIVHDAMACASFLKFHPSLPKEGATVTTRGNVNESHFNISREEKAQHRHSVEVANAGNYLNIRPSTLETLTKCGNSSVNRRYRKNFNGENDDKQKLHSLPEVVTVLPPALRCLVYLWEQLCSNCIQIVQTNAMEPLKTCSPTQKNFSSKDKLDLNEKDSKKSRKKKKDDGSWCELCEIFLPIPVTYHMRIVHPGCGKSAKGKGYNSVGVFCEGWAGNCGEGGKGASSWFLMCDTCREKYIATNKNVNNINQVPAAVSPTDVNLFGVKAATLIANSETYTTMKENAIFLLELSSSTTNLLATQKRSPHQMPVVTENQLNLFTDLNKPGTSRAESIPNSNRNSRVGLKMNGKFGFSGGTPNRKSYPTCISPELMWHSPDTFSCLESLGASMNDDLPYEIFGINSADNCFEGPISEVSFDSCDPNNSDMMTTSAATHGTNTITKFHRSFSMGQGWAAQQHGFNLKGFSQNFDEQQPPRVILRRRNISANEGESSLLLCYPSENLRKLVPDGVLNTSVVIPTQQRPVTIATDEKLTEANLGQVETMKFPKMSIDIKDIPLLDDPNNEIIDYAEKALPPPPPHILEPLFASNNPAVAIPKQNHANDLQNEKGLPNNLDLDLNVNNLLTRPTMAFITQHHNLDKLRYAMRRSVRIATCRIYALQALNWLVRSVTQSVCLHDLMWWFVASLNSVSCDDLTKLEDGEQVLEHPVSFTQMSGRVSQVLSQSLHVYLQSVADLTLLLPAGSSLQRIAIQCFGIKFRQADHQFLHSSHVFGNISKILSKSDEQNEAMLVSSSMAMGESNAQLMEQNSGIQMTNAGAKLFNYTDLNGMFEITVSSRQGMADSLTDNSTETFWESDEEDRNKCKIIEVSMIKLNYVCKIVLVHIDNSRDIQNKVLNVVFFAGQSLGDTHVLKSVDIEQKSCTWVSAKIPDESYTHFRLEFRGPENTLRVRQIKLLGLPNTKEDTMLFGKASLRLINAIQIQQKICEAETLRVFRLLTAQVFGKLISTVDNLLNDNINLPSHQSIMELSGNSLIADSLDLREHMVGILFSRSKLSHLQKQVIVHIVHAIKKEAQRAKEEWEMANTAVSYRNARKPSAVDQKFEAIVDRFRAPDTYCFEMLSMVLALSGSAVGRSYLSHQHGLLKDLLSLLHTGSDRVQRQVTALLRRILPEISPESLGDLLGVQKMPPFDYNIVNQSAHDFDMNRLGILDIFLSIIAKSLQLQVKVKTSIKSNLDKTPSFVKLSNCIDLSVHLMKPTRILTDEIVQEEVNPSEFAFESEPSAKDFCDFGIVGKKPKESSKNLNQRWFLKGFISIKQAENIISLIKDMASGKLTEKWSLITKAAIAESVLNLTRLDEVFRNPKTCIKSATLWLALASLCVLDKDHVEKLSSGQWSKVSDTRPLCSNHDDGETPAIIQCETCLSLCGDCDRFLHLNRKTRQHKRTVCKEEEEAIRVELHESCGRTKLFWLLALADSKTLKGMVEFRDGSHTIISGPQENVGRCRFCGVTGNSGLLEIGNVCADIQCQEHAANSCSKIKQCGHVCGGVVKEKKCLPCLQNVCHAKENELAETIKDPRLTQDADDMCMICFVEALSCAPSIQLECGHVFHFHCCKTVLEKRWIGPRITFGFSLCPICKADIQHDLLVETLTAINSLKQDVKRKALMRIKYEGLVKSTENKDLSIIAMDRYAYYVCFKCQKAYYGGEARCDAEIGEKFDPEELVCGACSDVARAQMCPKHGTDFLEYKCRYCCSVAVFFCFGTTHFCDTCHDDFQRLTNIPKNKLPQCPAGPKAKQLLGEECPMHVVHPPTGEEFALGCGICRNAQTF